MVGLKISTIQTNDDALAALMSPSNCGLLILIEQLIKKAQTEKSMQRVRSCKLAEKLLSNYQKSSIVVTTTQTESPTIFVRSAIAKAVEISANPEAHHGILQTFASTLLSYLAAPADPHKETTEKLIHAWKDFSTHWLREEIHRTAMISE